MILADHRNLFLRERRLKFLSALRWITQDRKLRLVADREQIPMLPRFDKTARCHLVW